MSRKLRIAVMAGTPVDTAFGCELVKEVGWDAIPIAISKTPQEQTAFQIASSVQKEEVLLARLHEIQEESVAHLLVYCNSLSASVDFLHIAKKTNLQTRTPFDFYREIAPQYHRLGVLAANAQGAAGVERALVAGNPKLSLFSVANLIWVEAIERQEDPATIVQAYGLAETLHIFEDNGCEAVVLGCTHFPKLESALRSLTDLPIENGDHAIRAWLSQAISKPIASK